MILSLLLVLIGLVGLWVGSNLVIRGAKNIANHFRISAGFIGLTIVSIGTSIPEIALSIAGGLDRLGGIETSGLVVGNKIGSAANQLTLILGLIGLFGVIAVKKRIVWREGIMLLGSVLLLWALGLDGEYGVFEGWAMIIIYLLYLAALFREESVKERKAGRRPAVHPWADFLRLTGGLLLVIFASDFVIENGVHVAQEFGLSQAFIGIFLLGLGTGLPELAVGIAGVRKKEYEISTSNLIGSNICDLLFSLGAGTVIAGFVVPARVLSYDLPALLLISLFAIHLFRTDLKITRHESLGLIVAFAVYLGIRLAMFG